METINEVPLPTNDHSLVARSLEERYDRIIEVIAGSEYAEQVAPELWLELSEIVLKLESE